MDIVQFNLMSLWFIIPYLSISIYIYGL